MRIAGARTRGFGRWLAPARSVGGRVGPDNAAFGAQHNGRCTQLHFFIVPRGGSAHSICYLCLLLPRLFVMVFRPASDGLSGNSPRQVAQPQMDHQRTCHAALPTHLPLHVHNTTLGVRVCESLFVPMHVFGLPEWHRHLLAAAGTVDAGQAGQGRTVPQGGEDREQGQGGCRSFL